MRRLPCSRACQAPPGRRTAEEEEIVITGFRASLAEAIDIKREETAAVDAIVAEDIADFPDNNLSESIQRIPGVAITRSNGEGRNISVRGLGPQFTRVRLNGMEAMSAMGSTDAEGGTNRGRNFDFNIFASELFNSITVRKTARSGWSKKARSARLSICARRGRSTMTASRSRPRCKVATTIFPRPTIRASPCSDQQYLVRTARLGALFSVAFSDRESIGRRRQHRALAKRRHHQFRRCRLRCALLCRQRVFSNRRRPRCSAATFDAVNQPSTRAFRATISMNTRKSALARPSRCNSVRRIPPTSRWTCSTPSTTRRVRNPSWNRQCSAQTARPESTRSTSPIRKFRATALVYGEFDDVDIRSEFRQDELNHELRQVSLSVEQEFGDRVKAACSPAARESDHSNPVQTTLLWDRTDIDGYVYDYRDNNRLPLITYGGAAVDTAAFWAGGVGPTNGLIKFVFVRSTQTTCSRPLMEISNSKPRIG